MDDSDDETGYPSRPYTSSLRPTRPIRNPTSSSYPRYPYNNQFQYYNDDDESDEDEEEEEEEENQEEFSSGETNGYDNNNTTSFHNRKKRKLETLVSNYEFAPRHGMWNEEESYVLLEVWGERYLELGRRSLRAEDWSEVAEKVTEMIGADKTEIECRNQLDVLKKKYKKEITKMEKNGVGGFYSKWPFFKKMDMLMNLRMKGHCGLGCGLDSGEYVFMDPRMYLDKSNVLDEMRDSPAGSDAEDNEEDEEKEEGSGGDDESAKLLADSIQRFGLIYEKIENSKRKQMMELEKMRRDFQRDLELQKKQIVDRAQAEIAKIREDDENDDDQDEDETDNISLRG
ncbi:trihelix transcription factor ENAP1 [Lycium barbarum]|uniref:trihelix transcription factor ENAP1 n=1 Tax=Lycium barbarum TaxID=112863 RepID=UPI00293F31FA|nr:trihelix transcription factor ENAP1 [Lycium barbarum]XP_060213590.1 trihelix transcription factor ENAP1 [Lycium barbarum]